MHLEMATESLLSPLSWSYVLSAKPTSLVEIRGIINKLANRKSPGYDHVINKVIENLLSKTIIHLTHIYNARYSNTFLFSNNLEILS